MVKGVISIEPVTENYELQIARSGIRHELINKLYNVLKEE